VIRWILKLFSALKHAPSSPQRAQQWQFLLMHKAEQVRSDDDVVSLCVWL